MLLTARWKAGPPVMPSAIVLIQGCKGNAASSGWKCTSDSTAQHHVFFRHKPLSSKKKALEDRHIVLQSDRSDIKTSKVSNVWNKVRP
jgi:hypothetical protein